MKINERIIVGYKTETRERWIEEPTEENHMAGHMEEYEVELPITEVVYRDATADEEAEAQRMAEEMPPGEPTIEEQLADLSDYIDVLTEMVLGGAE